MTGRNGMAQRIVAYVAEHPGCTRADLLAGCGIADIRSAMPTYCVGAGLVHAAGPRGSQRFFPTLAEAFHAHDRICAEVKARRETKKRSSWVRDNVRRRAQRHAAGGRARNTRPNAKHAITLDPGVTLAPDVRIVIAPPMRERWA